MTGEGKSRRGRLRWQPTGSHTNLTALLVERADQGVLSPSMLSLSAYLGHPAARAALGPDAPRPAPEAYDDVEAASVDTTWISRLAGDEGSEVATRAAVAIARHFLPLHRGAIPAGEARALGHALDRLERWLVDPTPVRAAAIRLARSRLDARIGAETWSRAPAAALRWGLAVALAEPHPGFSVERAYLRFAVAEEVTPWALGLRDPVRERVARPHAEPCQLEELAAQLILGLNHLWGQAAGLGRRAQAQRHRERLFDMFHPYAELRRAGEPPRVGEARVLSSLTADAWTDGADLRLVEPQLDDRGELTALVETDGPTPVVIGRLRLVGHGGRLSLIELTPSA